MLKFPGGNNKHKAQELVYEAMDCIYHDEDKALGLCRKALKLYPNCIDALVMIAEVECQTIAAYANAMEKAVEAGRSELGAKCFKEDKGYFWGLLETRPFMRAMMQLATSYKLMGKRYLSKAIAIFEEMLELNPNDNQGVRDILVDCYLADKSYDKAGKLIKQYEENSLAVFNWARVLLAYATEGKEAADKEFKSAKKQNEYVARYLSGKKRVPKEEPQYYSPGDVSEAIYCCRVLKEAWKSHPEAKLWLKSKC
ncbi:hypothetical protein SMSP2_01818 [Limihaloglobus sulfuriphilus]|uniref:Uncharacterized protein n=1 Tax=Limihaloglobus sulfuriphilus TaxID=1851148 RepID=A0A1Q2MFL9_9BACT|nr:tetratricopeptide repeat protein [Limihaloglobus sulfuriphilus]AQQ71444.1 hypothetical protein SMSP2_01818 [Limihaloglobus sulfuriphilus]